MYLYFNEWCHLCWIKINFQGESCDGLVLSRNVHHQWFPRVMDRTRFHLKSFTTYKVIRVAHLSAVTINATCPTATYATATLRFPVLQTHGTFVQPHVSVCSSRMFLPFKLQQGLQDVQSSATFSVSSVLSVISWQILAAPPSVAISNIFLAGSQSRVLREFVIHFQPMKRKWYMLCTVWESFFLAKKVWESLQSFLSSSSWPPASFQSNLMRPQYLNDDTTPRATAEMAKMVDRSTGRIWFCEVTFNLTPTQDSLPKGLNWRSITAWWLLKTSEGKYSLLWLFKHLYSISLVSLIHTLLV